MNTKLYVITAIFAISLTACKGDKDKEEQAQKAPVGKEYFNVEIDASTPKKDDFAVYFTEDGTNNFTGANATWKGIAGTGEPEKLVFDLPEQVVPTQIRLDFGLNKDQGDITIYNIKMGFYENSLNIKGSDFFNYFIKDTTLDTQVDAASGTLKIIRGKEFRTPFFYPTQQLVDSVAKMTTGK